MKRLRWLIEPVTGDRYVKDQWPDEKLVKPIWKNYKKLGDYRPIVTWGEFSPKDTRWDNTLLKRNEEEYVVNSQLFPNAPVPISAALLQMGKSYARKEGNNTRNIGSPGVYFWAWWPRIDPCWVVISATEAYKLLTEHEAGMKRTGEQM